MTNTIPTAEKNLELARRFMAARASGMTVQAAFESVFGLSYAKFAGDIYDALIAKSNIR